MADIRSPKTQDANLWADNAGTWHFDVRLTRRDGGVFRRNGIGPTKKEARDKRNGAYEEFNRDQGRTKGSHTVRDFALHCQRDVWSNELAAKTMVDYQLLLDKHILPLLGGTKVAELTTEQTQIYFNHLLREGVGVETVKKIKNVLSSLLTRAVRQGIVTGNCVRFAAIRDESRHRQAEDGPLKDKRILTPSERDALWQNAQGTYIDTAVLLAMKMGLRSGECLGLQWANVDFAKGTIKVRQQIQRIRGQGLQLCRLKTPNSVRDLPMPESVLAYMETERQRATSPFVVSNGLGKPLEASRLRQVFGDLAWISGLMTHLDPAVEPLPEPTFHDLRSTFLSMMANEHNLPARTLMQLAGHSDIQVTLQYYVRAPEETLAQAMLLVK